MWCSPPHNRIELSLERREAQYLGIKKRCLKEISGGQRAVEKGSFQREQVVAQMRGWFGTDEE